MTAPEAREAEPAASETPSEAATAPKPAPSTRKLSPWHDGKSLTRAKNYWNRDDIQGLLDRGGDPNERRGPIQQAPLQAAVQFHVRGFVIPLLEAGADPLARDVLGKDVLTHLTPGGWDPRIEEARAVVLRIRPLQDLSVIDLIRLGDHDRFAAWLATSPDLEQHWDLERTPLLWAAYFGRARMARELIAAGSRPTAVDYRRDSALHFAAMNGDLDLVRQLLALGVPMNATNAYGQTPLAQSLHADDTGVMGHLLGARADPCIGPNGRSDMLDLADSGRTPNRDRALALLKPAMAAHGCRTSPQEARRRNLQGFIDELAQITPPPPGVRADPDDDAFSSRDHFWAQLNQFNQEIGATLSIEEYDRLQEQRRRFGYRALLSRPDDAWFVRKGSIFWRLDRRLEALDSALAIENLRLTRFFYIQDREPCPLCDPGEIKWANSTAVSVRGFLYRHLRKGQLLIGVDLCEKFIRELGEETTHRYVVIQELLATLFTLGRTEEALAIGEAELDRTYGTSPKRYKNKVGWMVAKIRKVTEEAAAEAQVTRR